MNLNTHDHTRVPAEACPQKCIHRGMPKDAPAQAHPQRSACQGMSTQVHLQRHLKCTSTYMTTQLYLHRHVHVGEPTEACSCWCICRGMSKQIHLQKHLQKSPYTGTSTHACIQRPGNTGVSEGVCPHRQVVWTKWNKQSMNKRDEKYFNGTTVAFQLGHARICHIQKHVRKSNTGLLYNSQHTEENHLLNMWLINCTIHKLQQANLASLFLKKISCGVPGTASVI